VNSIRHNARIYLEAVVPSVQGDGVFEEVTQHRQCPGYSACGDLPAALLEALGVTNPVILNRAGLPAPIRYGIGENVSKLYNGARKLGVWIDYAPFRVPKFGDCVLIGRKTAGEEEHLLCFRETEETEHAGVWWWSYDYGQIDADNGDKPSSTIRSRRRADKRLDGREIIGWVCLDLVQARLLGAP
jgi:hypothetical protein